MGLINTVKDFFKRNKSNKNFSNLFTELKNNIKEAPSRERYEILEAYSKSPWLRAVTSKIANTVGSAKMELYFKGKKIKGNHEIKKLLDKMNPFLPGSMSRELIQLYQDLIGEAYILKERNKKGKVVELFPINPVDVRELPDNPLTGYYKVYVGNGEMKVPARDIISLKNVDPIKPYGRGTGLAHTLGDEIDIDEFSSKFIKNFFYNNARPDILISGKGYSDLSKEDTKRLEQKWLEKNKGFSNAYKPFFLSREVNVTQLTQSFDNMQLTKLRASERDYMIQIFGVPPEQLGIIENSNRATIESAELIYSKHVVKPRLNRLEEMLNLYLVSEWGDNYKIKFENPEPIDSEMIRKLIEETPDIFTIDELRDLARLSPVEGGEEFYESLEEREVK